jgi:mannose-6-phosphate isomerase-like protein (cupin superfamily)
MQIIHKPSETFQEQETMHGSASQSGVKLSYLAQGELANVDFSAFTRGLLPGNCAYDWHTHQNIEEVMLVIGGIGVVEDRDGSYPCKEGDVFVFPANIEHRIESTSNPLDMIFFRMQTPMLALVSKQA